MRHIIRPSEELLSLLDMLNMDFAVVGSAASSAYGEPRESSDVDLLALCDESQLARLSLMLGTDFYLDRDAARIAVRCGAPFHILSMRDMTRFHFYAANVDPFGAAELARKSPVQVDFLSDTEVPVTSPEDVVLAKLRWYDKGGRSVERHLRDVAAIVQSQGRKLDWKHIDTWAERLGVTDLVAQLPRAV